VHIFQDRVGIINPGGLVGGMTLEKLGSVSLPRNPLLFGMMHRMGLVEKIGSGLKRIADMCREQQTPSLTAEISEAVGRLSARKETAKDLRLRRINRIRTVQGSLAIEGNTLSTEQITAILDGKHLLQTLVAEMSREEIQSTFGLKDRKSFRARYLMPALAEGWIEMTLPKKPNSRLQKYRLTDQGRRRLQRRNEVGKALTWKR
jgi:ATP-dependent DNA helicase RecG